MIKLRNTIMRSNNGSIAAELPIVLWVLLFVFFFPLLNLATTYLRLTFLYASVHNGAITASRARSFQTSINGKPSAIQLAQSGANAVQNSFSGLKLNSIATEIVTTNVTTLAVSRSSTPLATPADTSNNTYQIGVTVTGSIQPLLPSPVPFNIPGISSPLTATISDRQYCENPQGLNL